MSDEHTAEYLSSRRTGIDMAMRRVKEGSGSYHAGLTSRTQVQQIPLLCELFGDIPFIIVGGFATRLYMPERMTLDIDVMVDGDDMARVEERLNIKSCTLIGPLTIGGQTWKMQNGFMLDVLSATTPWMREAVSNPVVGSDKQPYIDLPHLVLMKLRAGRMQDMADISRMLGLADEPALDAVRTIVGKFSPADIDDVESLIKLGRLEHATERKE